MKLRDWQRRALHYADKNPYSIFQCATGTGKTIFVVNLIARILKQNPSTSIIVIVPKNVILEENWLVELRNELGVEKIGVYYGELKEKRQVTITNMQSIENVGFGDFDVAVFDELHNYMSERMLRFIRQEKQRKIGLTATLHRDDYKHWSVLIEFDFNIFEYTLNEGIKDEVLSSFNFYNVLLHLDARDYEDYNEVERKLVALDSLSEKDGDSRTQRYNLLDRRKKILGMNRKKFAALKKLTRGMQGRKLIIFNEYNSAADDCYWNMLDNGFRPCIFNSSIPKNVRYANLKHYRDGKFDTIITTRALDEGYDLPKIDVAIILCGGSTDRQMVQRAGRVLRKKVTPADIYQLFFKHTIEEEHSVKRYRLIRDSCDEYKEIDIDEVNTDV